MTGMITKKILELVEQHTEMSTDLTTPVVVICLFCNLTYVVMLELVCQS